jgi:hypothetical protein
MLCLPKRDGRDIGERSDAVLWTVMPGHDKKIIQLCFGFAAGFLATGLRLAGGFFSGWALTGSKPT